MSRFVIGDVHGQFEGLMMLMDEISPKSSDQVFFLGDLIDRGSQSAEVVSWVMKSGYACIKGNHEQMCLEAFNASDSSMLWQGWITNGGSRTLDSYGENGMPNEHLRWMKHLPLYIDLGDAWLVHAGVDPHLSIEDQSALEFCWIREPFHSSTQPYFAHKTIITGHTITFVFPGVQPGQIAQGPGWLDIDTGAYHPKSGWLTALELDSKTVYQVNVYSQLVRQMPLEDIAASVNPVPARSGRKRLWDRF